MMTHQAAVACRYLVDRANLLLFVDLPNGSKRLLTLQEVQELMVGLLAPASLFFNS
jgi:hypothetical protein